MSKASEEAQKQLDRIVALGYPDVADMSAAAFRSLARPLIRALEDCGDEAGLGTQILLVPTRELVSPESLIARTSINRMAGFTTMPPRDIASFLPQDGFEPPEGPFYLVIEPHTGTCYINREPDVARKLIDSDERPCRSHWRKVLRLPHSIRNGCWRRTASICWAHVPRTAACPASG